MFDGASLPSAILIHLWPKPLAQAMALAKASRPKKKGPGPIGPGPPNSCVVFLALFKALFLALDLGDRGVQKDSRTEGC